MDTHNPRCNVCMNVFCPQLRRFVVLQPYPWAEAGNGPDIWRLLQPQSAWPLQRPCQHADAPRQVRARRRWPIRALSVLTAPQTCSVSILSVCLCCRFKVFADYEDYIKCQEKVSALYKVSMEPVQKISVSKNDHALWMCNKSKIFCLLCSPQGANTQCLTDVISCFKF